MLAPRARAVLDYWFGDLDQTRAYFARRNQLWFGGGDAVDGHIREHFASDLDLAVTGRLADWQESPKGALALIVLLDQFSLNLHREKPRSYEQSALAIPVAEQVIERGWEWVLTPAERVFVYLPFEHGEDLATQERSVALFERLARESSPELREIMDDYHHWAVRHWRVVARFGRFPDRNEVFGRPSTAEEVAFLASDEAPF
jgi:uncharacterized protein (DUF924 family)